MKVNTIYTLSPCPDTASTVVESPSLRRAGLRPKEQVRVFRRQQYPAIDGTSYATTL